MKQQRWLISPPSPKLSASIGGFRFPPKFSQMVWLRDHFIKVMSLVGDPNANFWPGVLKNLESFCKANMATDNWVIGCVSTGKESIVAMTLGSGHRMPLAGMWTHQRCQASRNQGWTKSWSYEFQAFPESPMEIHRPYMDWLDIQPSVFYFYLNLRCPRHICWECWSFVKLLGKAFDLSGRAGVQTPQMHMERIYGSIGGKTPCFFARNFDGNIWIWS